MKEYTEENFTHAERTYKEVDGAWKLYENSCDKIEALLLLAGTLKGYEVQRVGERQLKAKRFCYR